MSLPNMLKNMNLYIDGESYQGIVEEVKLPKLSRKFEDFRGGGMDGPVAIDLGQEKIELEITAGGFVLDAFKTYGTPEAGAVLYRFMGAYQRDDTGDVTPVEIVVRGRYQEIDPGDGKLGDKTQTKPKVSCSYYKLIVNGAEVIEIDLINFISIVDGKDRLAEQRRAIGLA